MNSCLCSRKEAAGTSIISNWANAVVGARTSGPTLAPRRSAPTPAEDSKTIRPSSPPPFRPKDGSGEPPPPGRNGEADFRKTKPSNETHASTTHKDARLYRKGDGQSGQNLKNTPHLAAKNHAYPPYCPNAVTFSAAC